MKDFLRAVESLISRRDREKLANKPKDNLPKLSPVCSAGGFSSAPILGSGLCKTMVAEAVDMGHIKPNRGIEIVVELPGGSMDKTRRTFWVPQEATAEDVFNNLALHFHVTKDSWNLYSRQKEGEIPSPIRDMSKPICEYIRDRNVGAQLYFYPEVLI